MRRNNSAKLHTADVQTKRFGYSMITPTLVVLLIMTAYPLLFTLFYSFTDYNCCATCASPRALSRSRTIPTC